MIKWMREYYMNKRTTKKLVKIFLIAPTQIIKIKPYKEIHLNIREEDIILELIKSLLLLKLSCQLLTSRFRSRSKSRFYLWRRTSIYWMLSDCLISQFQGRSISKTLKRDSESLESIWLIRENWIFGSRGMTKTMTTNWDTWSSLMPLPLRTLYMLTNWAARDPTMKQGHQMRLSQSRPN